MPEADLVLTGGTVIVLDRASTVAQALAVRDGRIDAVGPDVAVVREAGPRTRRIDLAGRTVVPKFFDAHRSEGRRGSREMGRAADLVVLGDDPLTCPEDRIKDLSVDLTVVGGRVVHERGPGA